MAVERLAFLELIPFGAAGSVVKCASDGRRRSLERQAFERLELAARLRRERRRVARLKLVARARLPLRTGLGVGLERRGIRGAGGGGGAGGLWASG